jgi:hypothetical protein
MKIYIFIIKTILIFLSFSILIGCIKVMKKEPETGAGTTATASPTPSPTVAAPSSESLPAATTPPPSTVSTAESPAVLPSPPTVVPPPQPEPAVAVTTPPTPSPSEESGSNKPSISFKIEDGEKPHQYFLKIGWKPQFKKIIIEDNLNKNQRIFENSDDEILSTTIELKDDTFFKLSLLSIDGLYPQVIGEIEGKSPTDYVIESNQELKQSAQIDVERFFILNSSKLKTNGFDLIIRAKKIFAMNAEIFTFDPLPLSKVGFAPNGIDGANGKSGGMIDISSQMAIGAMVINLRGQTGGDGQFGEPYASRSSQGLGGEPGAYSFREVDTGRKIGVTEDTLIPLPEKQYYCSTNPKNGHRGDRGLAGHRGGNAGSGGSSGFLNLNIDEQSSFQVKLNREVGFAGKIGEGGPGQLGGLGGPAGVFVNPIIKFSFEVITNYCQKASDGDFGENGPQGSNGYPGSDGLLERSCISIGQGKGYCKSTNL